MILLPFGFSNRQTFADQEPGYILRIRYIVMPFLVFSTPQVVCKPQCFSLLTDII